jgi:hypothetical protein
MAKKMAPGEGGRALVTKSGRKVVARRDTLDFRDQMYVATLVEVPPKRPLAEYQERGIPILDQGQEGACSARSSTGPPLGYETMSHFLNVS